MAGLPAPGFPLGVDAVLLLLLLLLPQAATITARPSAIAAVLPCRVLMNTCPPSSVFAVVGGASRSSLGGPRHRPSGHDRYGRAPVGRRRVGDLCGAAQPARRHRALEQAEGRVDEQGERRH